MKNHIDSLIQQTKNANSDIRRQGAIELGKSDITTSCQEVIHTLVELLDDEKIAVREAAEEALVGIGGREVVGALIPCLSSTSTTKLNYSVEILSRIGQAAIDLILPLLESRDHDIRKFGCDILGNLKYSDGVYDLIELLNDPHVNVAIAAGEALGKIGNIEAVPYLIRVLQYPDTWMKCIAAEALGKIGDTRAVDPFIEMSAYEDPIVLYTVIKAMGNLEDERVLPYILSILQANSMFAPSAAQAIQHLATLRGKSVYEQVKAAGVSEHFVGLLISENPEVLRSAIRLVGHLQLKDAVHPLGRLLDHTNEDIVEEVTSALVRIGTLGLEEIHSVFEQIFPSLQPDAPVQETEPPPSAKIPIIRVLGEIGSRDSIALLIKALDPKIADEIRVESTAALGKILSGVSDTFGNTDMLKMSDEIVASAVTRLMDGLSDPCDALRISSAEALGDIGIKEAYVPLVKLLQDSSVDVREAASIALAKIQLLPQDEKLRPIRQLLQYTGEEAMSDAVRATAIRTISRIAGDHEADFIMTFLHDASSEVRVEAIGALRTFSASVSHYPKLPDQLIPLLHDGDFQVRVAAIQSLVAWGIRQLKEQENVQTSVSGVGSLREQLLTPLLAMLNDSQPRVQYEVCQQLAEFVPLLELEHETGETVVDALIALFDEEDTMVKIAAVETLTALKPSIVSTSKAIPVLQSLLARTDETELRDSLQQALSIL